MEKIIHQIWVGPFEIPDMEKYFVLKTKELNPDYKHVLWNNDNLPPLDDIILKKINRCFEIENYAFAADILRVVLVKIYGGIYMDIDWKPYKGFSDLNLENNDGLIVYHDEYTSSNDFFGCKSNNGYIDYLYKKIINSNDNQEFTPDWFSNNLKEYFGIKHVPDYSSLECTIIGKEWLTKMDNDNIKYLKRHGQFEKIYLEHIALNSWDSKHLKYFKEGNINYKETIYNVKY